MTPFDRLLASQVTERISVVQSRHWANPQITITLNQDKIELAAGIADFTEAVVAEMGHPLKFLTKKRRRAEVMRATAVVLEKIKEASSSVMAGGA